MLVGGCDRGNLLPSRGYRKQGERDTERGQGQDILKGAPPPGTLLPLGKSNFSKLPELPKDHYQRATQHSQGVPVGGIALLLFCC